MGQTLEGLFGEPYPVHLNGVLEWIAPITIDRLLAMRRVRAMLAAEAPRSDDTAVRQVADIQLLALASGLAAAKIEALSDDNLARLREEIERINAPVFGHGTAPNGDPSEDADPADSLTAIAMLVESGHSLAAVRGYTLAQVRLFAQCHARLAAERSINELCIARASQADSKVYQGFAERLETLLQASR